MADAIPRTYLISSLHNPLFHNSFSKVLKNKKIIERRILSVHLQEFLNLKLY